MRGANFYCFRTTLKLWNGQLIKKLWTHQLPFHVSECLHFETTSFNVSPQHILSVLLNSFRHSQWLEIAQATLISFVRSNRLMLTPECGNVMLQHNQSKPWFFQGPATKIAHSRPSGSNPKKASNECLYVIEPSLNETRALWSVYSFLMLPFLKTTAAPAAHWCHWGSSRTVDSAFKHFFFFFLDSIEGTKSNLVFEGMILSFSIAIVPLTSNLETVASLFWHQKETSLGQGEIFGHTNPLLRLNGLMSSFGARWWSWRW